MKIDPNELQDAIFCDPSFGPIFGGGLDLCIVSNANTSKESYSDLGCNFTHPQHTKGTNEARSFLAGSFKFELDEIEVNQKE